MCVKHFSFAMQVAICHGKGTVEVRPIQDTRALVTPLHHR